MNFDTTHLNNYGYEEGLLSNSMLQSELQCGYKYQKYYIEKIDKQDGKFTAASAGNIVHLIAEDIFLQLRDGALGNLEEAIRALFVLNLEKIAGVEIAHQVKIYIDCWHAAYVSTLEEGRRTGKNWKAPEWTGHWKKSYSHLDTLREGMRKKWPGGPMDTPLIDWAVLSWQCLMNFKQLFAQINVGERYELEAVLTGELFGESFTGTADRLDWVDGEIWLSDYKTGASGSWTGDKLRNSDQFMLYAVLIKQRYGVLPTKIRVIDLRGGEIISIAPLEEDIERFMRRYAVKTAFHKAVAQVYAEAGSGMDLPPAAGGGFALGCPCPLAYRTDEHRCPYYGLSGVQNA